MTFPRLDGYKWEVPDENLAPEWTSESSLRLNSDQVPTKTEVRGIVGEAEFHTLDDLKAQRPQAVAFELAKLVLEALLRGTHRRDRRPDELASLAVPSAGDDCPRVDGAMLDLPGERLSPTPPHRAVQE